MFSSLRKTIYYSLQYLVEKQSEISGILRKEYHPQKNTIPCTSACTGFSIFTCLWKSNESSEFSHSIQQRQKKQMLFTLARNWMKLDLFQTQAQETNFRKTTSCINSGIREPFDCQWPILTSCRPTTVNLFPTINISTHPDRKGMEMVMVRWFAGYQTIGPSGPRIWRHQWREGLFPGTVLFY